MEAPPSADVGPTARRWLMLALFCLVTMANGFQWIQFAIISDSVAWFYGGVSTQDVQWTSLMYMVTYIPCILPASWFLDAKGLSWTVKLAAVGNCVAAWLKVAAARPDLLAVLFVGQGFAAVTQVLVLSVPPRLAAVWFGAHQVSTATAIGVIGNQVGNALGFVVPSLLVRSPRSYPSPAAMQGDMLLVGYLVAGATTVIAGLVLFFFQEEPSFAPSVAQAAVRLQGGAGSGSLSQFRSSVRAVLASPGYPQLLIAYGISTGVCFAASTVLNDLILSAFPDSEDDAGFIGLLMVVAGLVGSVICGLVLDATAKFKEMTVVVYGLSVVALVAFTGALLAGHIWVVYIAGALAGLALAGYVAVGFEFAAELTYPEPEGTSSGLLNAAAQLLGIVFTVACQALLPMAQGWRWACTLMTAVLVVGACVSLTIPNSLRRQAAQRAG